MQNMVRVIIAVAVLVIWSTAQADNELTPSEITILVNHALEASPGIDRRTITTPLVARMRVEGLSEIERFMKGEVHFLHLQPEESRDEYWAFRDRNDDLGRVAWQRLMVIRINAFGMLDEVVERDIPTYKRRFPIRADDRHGITFPVMRTAQLLIEAGRVGEALDLLAEHVRAHDKFDSPYTAYALPGQFGDVAAENGRGSEFDELREWVLSGLSAAINDRLQNPEQSGPKPLEIPGQVFFSLYADRDLDFYEWTGEFIKLRDRIADGSATGRARPGT